MIELEGVPELVDPVMVAAFEGWNDAGDAASTAVGHMEREWKGEVFAALDAEDYYDFQVNRPHVWLDNGSRKITWPTTRLAVVRVDNAAGKGKPRDLVLVRGIEPSMRWRSFCNEILGFAHELGVEMVVVLGALLGDTPHTRPVPVTGVTSDPDLARTMGLEESRYEGPTGIVGILQEACTHAGVPAVSLWASVPHYVSQPPNPKATLALLNRLEDLLQLNVPLGELPEDARAWQIGVDQLAAEDSEVAEYVQSLEDARDTAELPEASGEAIAKEFERYLRRRDGGDSRESGAASRHATDTKPPETESGGGDSGEDAGAAEDAVGGPEPKHNGQGEPQHDADGDESAEPAKPRKSAKKSSAKKTAAKKAPAKKATAKKPAAKKAAAKKPAAKKTTAKKTAAKKTAAKKTGTGKSTKSTRSRKSADSSETPETSPNGSGSRSEGAENSKGRKSRKDDGTSEASKPRRTTRRKSAKPEDKPEKKPDDNGGGDKPSDEK